MMEQLQGLTLEERKQEASRVASALYRQDPDWVTFFREILGISGVVRRLFPEREWMGEFEKTTEYTEIQLMLARLRQRSSTRGDSQEPIRVITVRLPRSLHETLQAEAYAHETSMNKLCITKLLRMVDGELAETQFNAADVTHERPNP